MKNKLLILALMVVTLASGLYAGFRSYGNDYLNLLWGPGGELYGKAYGLLSNGSENVMLNAANLSSASEKPLYLYYSSWFKNQVSASSLAYRFSYADRSMGIMVSRVGVDDIPDSRQALLDYGLDGIPGTGDSGEGNGRLDENEIIDYDGVSFTSTSNYTVHFATELGSWKSFNFGLSAGFLYANLSETSGLGLTLNAYAQHRGKHIQSLYSIRNIPSAVMVYQQGLAEYYAPALDAAWIYSLELGNLKITPGINAGISLYEDQQTALITLADAVSLQIQPILRINYNDFLALGFSYRSARGIYGGMEIMLKNLDICYSFRPMSGSDLGSSHLISLRISPQLFK